MDRPLFHACFPIFPALMAARASLDLFLPRFAAAIFARHSAVLGIPFNLAARFMMVEASWWYTPLFHGTLPILAALHFARCSNDIGTPLFFGD
jgi:hypothetical protein